MEDFKVQLQSSPKLLNNLEDLNKMKMRMKKKNHLMMKINFKEDLNNEKYFF